MLVFWYLIFNIKQFRDMRDVFWRQYEDPDDSDNHEDHGGG